MKATVHYKTGHVYYLGKVISIKLDENDEIIRIIDANDCNIEIDRKSIKSIEIN